MSKRDDLLASIADTIKDYRKDEIPARTPERVERWIEQFPKEVQLPILSEMNHVLKHSYFSLERVKVFLQDLVEGPKLVGDEPCAFWRGVNFLDIQQGGNSQTEMLKLFDNLLKDKCGFGIAQCNSSSSVYIYLDDGIFTGNRVRRDIEMWISSQAPAKATLHIVTIAIHLGGKWYACGKIRETAANAGKEINIKWWRAIQLEDRKSYSHRADVLRPTSIPDDVAVRDYIAGMEYEPLLRRPGNIGTQSLFSSDEKKILLEREFLIAGARIRQLCPNLGDTQRPLGHMTLDTLGFGSLIVTFRNCPNNAPLALWAGDPWYPLFPRTTNTQTELNRFFE